MPIRIQNAAAWKQLLAQFDLKGKHQLQLDETIVPVVPLTLKSTAGSPKVGGDNVAAVALEQGVVGVTNPAGSGIIVVVERTVINTSGGCQLRFDLDETGLTVGAPSMTRDLGRQLSTNVRADAITGTDPGPIGTFSGLYVSLQAALTQTYELGYILAPGHNIAWVCDTVNTLIRGSFFWLEFPEDLFGE